MLVSKVVSFDRIQFLLLMCNKLEEEKSNDWFCACTNKHKEKRGILFVLFSSLKVTLAIVIAYDWFHGERLSLTSPEGGFQQYMGEIKTGIGI